jgi:gluconokinase
MPRVIGLRSPHARVGRIVAFGRMLDKIRLHARGELPPEYVANLGEARPALFDARCCRFLGVPYAAIRGRVLEGGCDEEALLWAHARREDRSDEECVIWNRFMTKIGWRDDRSDTLRERSAEYGVEPGRAQTFCELLDLDEGRPPGATRSWETQPISAVVVMGVSGCGKTTVGRGLAAALGWEFLEADELHSPASIAKMAAGVALTDPDRAPWLEAVRDGIASRAARGARVVVACSALRAAYRRVLTPDPGSARYAHLSGGYELIRGRLTARSGHYMGEALLRSQFDTLEAPADALVLDASGDAAVIIERIRKVLALP